jgi:maleamate amidohydrolase
MSRPGDYAVPLAAMRERGFGERIGFGQSPAVIVIDMTRAYTDAASPLSADLASQIGAINQLLPAARRANAPVFYATIVYREHGSTPDVWCLKAPAVRTWLRPGSEWVDFDPRMDRAPTDRVIVKEHSSCFFGTNLAAELMLCGVDTVLLCGCSTSGCVRATAVDACAYNLRPVVVEQAVGDRAEYAHVASLADIDAKYGDVVSLEEALAYLSDGGVGQGAGSRAGDGTSPVGDPSRSARSV